MSLRKSLFVSLVIMLTIIGATTAAMAYWIAGDEANAFFDNELRQIAIYVWQSPSQLDEPPVEPFPHDPEDDFVVQIWDGAGRLLSDSNPETGIPMAEADGLSDFVGNGVSWRVFRRSTKFRTVQVSQQMVVRDELAAAASAQAALPIALSIPLAWMVLHWILGRVIGRLDKVASTLAAREAEKVDVIPVDAVPREILPLVTTVNSLVQRLQRSLELQRRFVADAAHELRTPLAAISIQVSNLHAAKKDTQLFAARVADLEAGVARMVAMVGQLLKLARYETDQLNHDHPTSNLTDLVVACLGHFAPVAELRLIDLGMNECGAAFVQGSGDDIRVLLDNIVDNAIKYSPIGGRVDVEIIAGRDDVALEVRDEGPGIPEMDLPRVCERFFRSGAVQVEGSGLGLSIAKAAADRSGIAVSLANRNDAGGLKARLTFRAAELVNAQQVQASSG